MSDWTTAIDEVGKRVDALSARMDAMALTQSAINTLRSAGIDVPANPVPEFISIEIKRRVRQLTNASGTEKDLLQKQLSVLRSVR